MLRYPSLVNIGILTGAFLLSVVCTWLLVKFRRTWGLDTPDKDRKLHDEPVSRLGGLGIFVSLCAGFLVMEWRFPEFLHRWAPVIISNCIIFVIGFADDIRPLGAKLKLVGQLGTATILYALGVSIDELSNPFGEGHFMLGWWSLPVTLLWLIAVPNIVNLIDGMDGLATGFGLFLCITLAFVGHYSGKPEVVTVSMIMGGALAGFLVFNFPPARIFLGDGGAYLLGFFIASVTVFTSSKGSVIAALLVVIVALGVPILDTLFTIIRRALMGVPLFRADAEHIHHRLILLGFSKTRALIAIYAVCLALSLVGMSIFWSKGLSLPIAGAALVLLALASARYLGYVKSWRDLRQQFNAALSRRRDMLYAQAYGRVLEWEAERCKEPEEFLSLMHLAIDRLGLKSDAEAGFESLHLPLITGLVCKIHIPQSPQARMRWVATAENLVPALNRATERWGTVPGLTFEKATQGAGPLSSSTNKITSK